MSIVIYNKVKVKKIITRGGERHPDRQGTGSRLTVGLARLTGVREPEDGDGKSGKMDA